ncbi:MAG: DUF6159 family protein [Ferroplasma sp.]|uniref:DUF6159 family protein n=1 Tax=Ferroplasma sp. TaxID=2591003 RepID=UPI00281662B2|nr:DUF6159 family protein [Ferroplasma sp.]WMT51312.1 MAG: DUF6159 family protein [Ferroplasma sp.]
MFEYMKNGWHLASQVRKSISRNRKLYIYPLLSGIVSVVVFGLTFFILILETPASGYSYYYYIVGIFVAYVLVYFFATLIIMAMMISYRSVKADNPLTTREAFSSTKKYIGKAFQWAILYSVLLMILRAIESRVRGIGGIIIASIGSFAITVATFFAVPVILDYDTGPINAIKISVDTIKSHFGDTFGGVIYIDLYTLIFTGGGFLLLIISAILLGAGIPLIVIAIIAAIAVIMIILGIILNFTYMNIFKLILFDYVNGRTLPDGIDENLLNSSIKQRGGGYIGNGPF